MSLPKRRTLVALAILTVLVVTEVLLNRLKGPEALVVIENLGDRPIESLAVILGSSRSTTLPPVAPGESAKVYLSGYGPETLRLSFRQVGNAMTGYQVHGFDPAQMRRDGFKLVLRVSPNEVVRFQDDAEPATTLGSTVRSLWTKFLNELGIEPDVKTQ